MKSPGERKSIKILITLDIFWLLKGKKINHQKVVFKQQSLKLQIKNVTNLNSVYTNVSTAIHCCCWNFCDVSKDLMHFLKSRWEMVFSKSQEKIICLYLCPSAAQGWWLVAGRWFISFLGLVPLPPAADCSRGAPRRVRIQGQLINVLSLIWIPVISSHLISFGSFGNCVY